MKNKPVTIILAIALLVSLYFNLQNKETKKGVEVNTQKVSLDNKQMCAVYKKEIEAKFETNNNSIDRPLEYLYLDKVFYSPKQNSCLYIYRGTSFGEKISEIYTTVYLMDALSGEKVLSSDIVSASKTDYEREKSFNARIKEYE
ncbi:MAG: hypothetical protein WC878_06405 [Candidatus Paceibacterota bacterium]|jgi:hypothetical protein